MKNKLIPAAAAALVCLAAPLSANAYPFSYFGDINRDGFVDAADASMILVEYANLSTGGTYTFSENVRLCADTNEDGLIDASDASNILDYYSRTSTGYKRDFAEFMTLKSGVWREYYLDVINGLSDPKACSYALFYLDNDTAPELAVYKEDFTTQLPIEAGLYTCNKYQAYWISECCSKLRPVRYIEGSGEFLSRMVNMNFNGWYWNRLDEDIAVMVDNCMTDGFDYHVRYDEYGEVLKKLSKGEYDVTEIAITGHFIDRGRDVVYVSYEEIMKMLK